MKQSVTLRWKSLGFALMLLLGFLLALMPDNLAVGQLESRLAEYAESMPTGGYTIDAATLATWLAAHEPVELIDVRERWRYDEYHIDGAVHMPLATVVTPRGLAGLDPDTAVVVLGPGEATGQAVAVLRLAGLEAYALEGGLAAWWDRVLRPASLDASIPPAEIPAEAARRAAWRSEFLGTAGAHTDVSPSAAPPVASAPRPGVPAAPQKSHKRGKGC